MPKMAASPNYKRLTETCPACGGKAPEDGYCLPCWLMELERWNTLAVDWGGANPYPATLDGYCEAYNLDPEATADAWLGHIKENI